MAITIQAQLSKKIPITGTDFSSQSASITISAEVTDPASVIPEAQRLYRLAEQAVDAQLRLMPSRLAKPAIATQPATPNAHNRPAPPRNQPRRGPAPVTESQLRFLDRLITQTGSSLDAILHQHHVAGLQELSCKDAAALIDELKRTAA